MKKNNYLYLLFFSLFLIPIFIGSFSRLKPPPTKNSNTVPLSVTLMPSPGPIDPNKKLLNKINSRETLTQTDATVKEQIIATLAKDPESTTLYQSTTVRIDYTASSNLFQAEILSIDTAEAKKEAVSWFLAKGMSMQGICNLPLDFYLNWDVKQEYIKTNETFNPLPDGC